MARFDGNQRRDFGCLRRRGWRVRKPTLVRGEEGVIRITKGYSRDHRPDLNQAVLQLVCERQAGIPILMQALDGNNSDKASFREMAQAHTGQMRSGFGVEILVADSALYTAGTLKGLEGIGWVTRVPETLELACAVIRDVAPDLMADPSQTAYRGVCTDYAGVRQRWVVVYSPEARRRALKTVGKRCLKQSTDELGRFGKLYGQDFACEADACKALAAFEKNLKMTCVTDAHIQAEPRFSSKGRPAQGRGSDFFVYRIGGGMTTLL
ncbi:hypothetical protein AADEFJLK_02422 [Methylovulum psychrotolerans]|uniref:IS1634 family transposase n=1 Tax=Methylovulum psychrotolerans TaxID=1704499 RepID=A0A2S5CHV9_9GAMM|nr:hypothetical protein AADEFJLK_03816 [Methylovulum psychrotolerans]POZ51555.1 hypothetical protein AADEFJLK_02422 [Methylovulum psychrotolerans]